MDSINSVAKVITCQLQAPSLSLNNFSFQGVFFFKNGKSIKELKKKRKSEEIVNKQNKHKHWYEAFTDEWKIIEQKVEVSKWRERRRERNH
jgi:hypothetical protein